VELKGLEELEELKAMEICDAHERFLALEEDFLEREGEREGGELFCKAEE